MRNFKNIYRSILSVVLLSMVFLPAAKAEKITVEDVHAPSAEKNGVSFEVQVPWWELTQERVITDNGTYSNLIIPGWPTTSEPGAPALPYHTEVIGVPFGVEISVTAFAGKSHVVKLTDEVMPAPTQEFDWVSKPILEDSVVMPVVSQVTIANSQIYQSHSAFPGLLSEVSSDGVLREQRMVSIAVYPIQYNPQENSLTVFETLQIEVGFKGVIADPPSVITSDAPVYESLFKQHLLNYEQGRNYREPAAQISKPTMPTINASVPNNQLTAGPWLPPDPAWRLKVRENGFYSLTYDELASVGLPVDDLDPRSFQIFNLGSEIAIEVTGESDASFDPPDSIIFYGLALESKYTWDNVYWLTYGQVETGNRILLKDGEPGNSDTPAFFQRSIHLESNHYYISGYPGEDELDRYLWANIFTYRSTYWEQPFELTAPASGSGHLKLKILGYLRNAIDPDHHIKVFINNVELPDADTTWDGLNWIIVESEIPDGLLAAGANKIKITCPNDTGVGYDYVFIDWVELTYPQTFQAENDTLAFNYAQGTWLFEGQGFSTDQLIVYDITNPNEVSQFVNFTIIPIADQFTIRFQDTIQVGSTSTYNVLAGGTYLSVQAIEALGYNASDLQTGGDGADYILITHQDFLG